MNAPYVQYEMRCYERPWLLQLLVITAAAVAACRMAKHKKEKKEKKDKKDKKRRRRSPSSTDDSSSDEEEYKRRKAEKLVGVGGVAVHGASVDGSARSSEAQPGLHHCVGSSAQLLARRAGTCQASLCCSRQLFRRLAAHLGRAAPCPPPACSSGQKGCSAPEEAQSDGD